MDKQHYEEMTKAFSELEREGALSGKKIYLFGHCNATEELADLLLVKGYEPVAILDNNSNKHGRDYREIKIVPPEKILAEKQEKTIVCIVARAYAAMADQLRRLGYSGQIRKLVDYNSYADYSLTEETRLRMHVRVERGLKGLERLSAEYSGYFKIFCPFQALGDIYFMMSYLPQFLKNRNKKRCVICVVGRACGEVVKLFTSQTNGEEMPVEYVTEIFAQKDMDELIQAAIYTQDEESYIAHQDRPYVNNLFKALYVKRIPLEQIYCCGVFGLPVGTKAVEPENFAEYGELEIIPKGQAVILSPYAKSVTALPTELWDELVKGLTNAGKKCFTNVVGDEKPLAGTVAISPSISEMKSVVERAGTFVGLRSGMCDVIRTARAEKIALFPDYFYCDTKWKSIDMYYMDGWDNIVVDEYDIRDKVAGILQVIIGESE